MMSRSCLIIVIHHSKKEEKMKNIVKVSVVSFHAHWGNKEANLEKIKEYIEIAGREGSHFIVFPEMALTGYDDVTETPKPEKMQTLLAETIPGPATNEVAELTKKYGIYAVFGMPERDPEKADVIYNSAAIVDPDGNAFSYRKMHLVYLENNWGTVGDFPTTFMTPWGLVSVSICYDTYNFPEIMRHGRAKGARLHLNPTALASEVCPVPYLVRSLLENNVLMNGGYIATANLSDVDNYDHFFGGSSIIGPSHDWQNVHYYAGHPFYSEEGKEIAMYSAVIDLSKVDEMLPSVFRTNEITGEPDYRKLDRYIKMNESVMEDEHFKSQHK